MAMGLQPIVTTIDLVRYFYNVIAIRIQQAVDEYNIKHIYSIFEGSTSIYIVSAVLQHIVTTIDRVTLNCYTVTISAIIRYLLQCNHNGHPTIRPIQYQAYLFNLR
jgi:hypothetical protein